MRPSFIYFVGEWEGVLGLHERSILIREDEPGEKPYGEYEVLFEVSAPSFFPFLSTIIHF